MTDWFVSQKVVCVDDSGQRTDLIATGHLSKSSIYTVREVVRDRGSCGLRLVEFRCKSYPDDGWEITPLASRFRSLINPETDLAQFEAILRGVGKPAGKRELVEA